MLLLFLPLLSLRSSSFLTWAVQMLEVALSLLMCCSLVCIAILRQGLPSESIVTPMMRPGICDERSESRKGLGDEGSDE